MSEVEIQKQKLREEYRLIRNNISNKMEKSRIIAEKLKQAEVYKKANIVALYKSLEFEVDTTEIIEYSIISGKTVVLPKVVGSGLNFYKISLGDKLVKSKFGVEEPLGDECSRIDKTNIDLVIVPGLCFDKAGNRLGFGKGYYDRFLMNTDLKTIGLCFKEQMLWNDLIPITEYDIKVQQIITDE